MKPYLDQLVDGKKELFSRKLKEVLKKRKKTQKWLASVIGVDEWTISSYATAKKYPDYPKIVRIADVLNVEPGFFLSEDIKETLSESVECFLEKEYGADFLDCVLMLATINKRGRKIIAKQLKEMTNRLIYNHGLVNKYEDSINHYTDPETGITHELYYSGSVDFEALRTMLETCNEEESKELEEQLAEIAPDVTTPVRSHLKYYSDWFEHYTKEDGTKGFSIYLPTKDKQDKQDILDIRNNQERQKAWEDELYSD